MAGVLIQTVYHGRTYKRDDQFEFEDLDLSRNKTISPFANMQIINRVDKFRPDDYLTRAEWTKILFLFLERRAFNPFIERRIF